MSHDCIAITLVARIGTKNRIGHRPGRGCEVFATCQVSSAYSVDVKGKAHSSRGFYQSDWF